MSQLAFLEKSQQILRKSHQWGARTQARVRYRLTGNRAEERRLERTTGFESPRPTLVRQVALALLCVCLAPHFLLIALVSGLAAGIVRAVRHASSWRVMLPCPQGSARRPLPTIA
jgi:hypothetical protein